MTAVDPGGQKEAHDEGSGGIDAWEEEYGIGKVQNRSLLDKLQILSCLILYVVNYVYLQGSSKCTREDSTSWRYSKREERNGSCRPCLEHVAF